MAVSAAEILQAVEQSAKLFDPTAVAPSQEEAFRRSVAIQVYYACYHRALIWAIDRGFSQPRGRSAHEALWDCWYRTDLATSDIATNGVDLRTAREKACYEIDSDFSYQLQDLIDAGYEFMDCMETHENEILKLAANKRKRKWDVTIYELGRNEFHADIPPGATQIEIGRSDKGNMIFTFRTPKEDIEVQATKGRHKRK